MLIKQIEDHYKGNQKRKFFIWSKIKNKWFAIDNDKVGRLSRHTTKQQHLSGYTIVKLENNGKSQGIFKINHTDFKGKNDVSKYDYNNKKWIPIKISQYNSVKFTKLKELYLNHILDFKFKK